MEDILKMQIGEVQFAMNRIPREQLNDKEKDFHRWILPTFEKYLKSYDWASVIENTNPVNKIVLELIVKEELIASENRQVHIPEQNILANMIGVPALDIENAKQDKDLEITLYSAKKTSYSAKTNLKYNIGHELTHCFYNPHENDLREAVASKVGLELIKGEKGEDEIKANYITTMVVEANILEYADIQDIGPWIMPFGLSPNSISLIQDELESYSADPDRSKQIYMRKKQMFVHSDPDYLDCYSSGFIKLLNSEK